MRVSHQRRLRREDLQPASCTLRIVPIRSEATSGAGNVALGDPPILASYASLVRRSLPRWARKFSSESVEGSHRSHRPSASWRSTRPHQKVWFEFLCCCRRGSAFSGLRYGFGSDLSLLCALDPGSSPCLLHIAHFASRWFGVSLLGLCRCRSLTCTVLWAQTFPSRFCHRTVLVIGALVATSDASYVKLLRELKSWRQILLVRHGVPPRSCLLFATGLVAWRVVRCCQGICQLWMLLREPESRRQFRWLRHGVSPCSSLANEREAWQVERRCQETFVSYVKLPKAEEAEFESAGCDLLTCSANPSLAVQVVCPREVWWLSLLDD